MVLAFKILLLNLQPEYVTLSASVEEGIWNYDLEELKAAIENNKTKALILNTPHNPTGKVFSYDELKVIIDMCIKNDVYIITDEIYEHMTYPDENGNPREHILIPKAFPEAADMTLVCNSLGKSASATGWRLGWCRKCQVAMLPYTNISIEYYVVVEN